MGSWHSTCSSNPPPGPPRSCCSSRGQSRWDCPNPSCSAHAIYCGSPQRGGNGGCGARWSSSPHISGCNGSCGPCSPCSPMTSDWCGPMVHDRWCSCVSVCHCVGLCQCVGQCSCHLNTQPLAVGLLDPGNAMLSAQITNLHNRVNWLLGQFRT